MSTFKDKATDFCALVIAISTAVAGAGVAFGFSDKILAGCGLAAAIATAFTAYLTGKGSDGKPKKTVE